MSPEKTKSVKARILALLNIAKDDSASEHEVELAMSKAQQLMGKYHLADEDLGTSEADLRAQIDASETGCAKAFIGKKMYAWEGWLGIVVTELVGGVKVYINHGKKTKRTEAGLIVKDPWGYDVVGKQLVFYGVHEDAMMAAMLYEELRYVIIALSWGKYRSSFKGEGGKYCEGFVSGLQAQVKRATNLEFDGASGGERGMILLRRDLIKQKTEIADRWLKEQGTKVYKGQSSSGASGSHSAFRAGREDGKSYDTDRARTKKIS